MDSLLVIILKLFESVELLQTSIITCMYSLLVKLFESVKLLQTSIAIPVLMLLHILLLIRVHSSAYSTDHSGVHSTAHVVQFILIRGEIIT